MEETSKVFVFSASLILLVSLMLFGCVSGPDSNYSNLSINLPPVFGSSPAPGSGETSALKSFKSWNELYYFLQAGQSSSYYGGFELTTPREMPMFMTAVAESSEAGEAGGNLKDLKAREYSTTNVQVEGVDEADVVKNDGEFLYVVVKNEKIIILKAFPPSEMKIVSEIPFASEPIVSEIPFASEPWRTRVNANVNEIFVNDGKLVVFGSEYYGVPVPIPLEIRSISENAGVSQSSVSASPSATGELSVKKSVPQATGEKAVACIDCIRPPHQIYQTVFIKVYDVTDKQNPKLLKTLSAPSGNYVNSRMIGSKVYAIFSQPAYPDGPPPLFVEDGVVKSVNASEVAYFDDALQPPFQFTSILSIDLNDLENAGWKTVLMGGAQNVFASSENLYVAYTKHPYYNQWFEAVWRVVSLYASSDLKQEAAAIDKMSFLPAWVKDGLKNKLASNFLSELMRKNADSARALKEKLDKEMQRVYNEMQRVSEEEAARERTERTVIQKFSLKEGVKYEGSASVKGSVLNQFSMDEYNGFFRIATTTEAVWGRQPEKPVKPQLNHVFVLDSKLKQVGKLEDVAPGEMIYSARFIGDRAYLVTFKKTDPLFVISLSDPANPEILGKLKIPGYSDYLHPYDATHLIGVGKSAVEAKEFGDFAWYQGVKLSLFDVSDVEHPREVAKYEIGDRGTDSNALRDHKAFLFNKNKNLLVIPILLAEIDESKYPEGVPDNAYGDFVFQGAYVFNVTLENGFVLRGTVTHADDQDLLKSGYYWFSDSSVKRTAFIENALYTISDNFVKANDLNTLQLLNYVQLNTEEPPFPPVLETAAGTTSIPASTPAS